MPTKKTTGKTKKKTASYNDVIPRIIGGAGSDGGMKKKANPTVGGPGTVGGISGGIESGMSFTRPVRYEPEFASPERWSFPKNIKKINDYFRIFYKFDPLVGAVIDIYTEMPLSDYEISGDGVDGEIKERLEEMFEVINFLSLMKNIGTEFLVVGEAIPHLFYNKDLGYWDGYSLHRQEDIEVVDTHLMGIEPVLILRPDKEEVAKLKKIKTAYEKFGIEQGETNLYMEELLTKKEVALENLNVTFIPRRLHEYELRGTSILTRLWRAFMYEDALANASIQTAYRHASPVKVVKMGDLASGYIPTEEQINELTRVLAMSETDPQAWVFAPPGTTFEAWGTNDRITGLKSDYEIIENMKLTALGVSRDFITGAANYASAQAGLQVLLSRLLAFRTLIEQAFVYPKFIFPIVKVNKWIRRSAADYEHNVRTTKNTNYVMPKIVWSKKLKVTVDAELLEAYSSLVRDFDVKLSERTLTEVVGINWSDEQRRIMEEKMIKSIMEKGEMEEGETPVGGLPGGGGRGFGGFTGEPKALGEGGGPEGGVEEIAPEPNLEESPGEVRMHASAKRQLGDVFLSGVYKPNGRAMRVLEDISVDELKDKIGKLYRNGKKGKVKKNKR